jgi:hypothetical protein
MAMGHWVSRIIYLAAKLNLADRLAGGPKSAEELAGPTETDARSLYRFMRSLSNLGILAESDSHRFALTPLGEALKTGAPGSARPTVLTVASDWWVRGFCELPYSVQTGKSGFEKSLGVPIFDFLAKNPEDASLFSETMIGFHGAEPPAVSEAYDFSQFNTIVDVGGASGKLLATILNRHAAPRGILFDLPHVVRDAPRLLEAHGVSDRVTIEPGSFFETMPKGADAYILSHIIHDWNEELCLTILGHCRRAMNPSGRVLIIEMVLPDNNAPHPGKMLDVMMLVGPGGQERTETEYAALLGKAGFSLKRVVPTASAVSIVEAVIAT